MSWWIYALSDPSDLKIRYVGFTSQKLSGRLSAHVSCAKTGRGCNKRLNKWISLILLSGVRPLIVPLEELSANSQDWQIREKFWIKEKLSDGCDLLNLTDGGEGILGFNHSIKTRAKISKGATKWQTGRKLTNSHIESMSKTLKSSDVIELRKLWDESPYRGFVRFHARRLKISESLVSLIIHRKRWTHIP